jgi:hypothetical protein
MSKRRSEDMRSEREDENTSTEKERGRLMNSKKRRLCDYAHGTDYPMYPTTYVEIIHNFQREPKFNE